MVYPYRQPTPDQMMLGAMRGSYQNAARQAGAQAMGAARTLGGTNPLAAARTGSEAASLASARIGGQQATAEAQMRAQIAERQRLENERRRTQVDRTIGGLLGAGGQLVGMLAPAFGPAAPAAGLASGGAQMLGGAMQPQPTSSPFALPPTAMGQPYLSSRGGLNPADLSRPAPQSAATTTLGMVDQAMAGQPQMTEEEMRRRLLGGPL